MLFVAACEVAARLCIFCPSKGSGSIGVKAEGVPSHAVVSAVKLPFLSWHLLAVLAQRPKKHRENSSTPADRSSADNRPTKFEKQAGGRNLSPAKPSLNWPTLHRTVGQFGVPNDAFVLHETEQFTIPRQIDTAAIFSFANLPILTNLNSCGQVSSGKVWARRCH